MNEDPPSALAVRVWDLPTRLFHWALAVCVVASVVSANVGGNAMTWHFRLGYTVFTLLAFRVLWGLVGGRWSRFSSFWPTPGRLRRYLSPRAVPGEWLDVGHNPLGSLSVLAMLGLLAAQVGTGLVADDEIANLGPLNRFVSSATAHAATGWHKHWGQWLLIALVVLHVAAIAGYRLRRGLDLVRPMLVGDKALPPGTPPSADSAWHRLLALAIAALCGLAVGWVVALGD
jgi:cytochrome b